RLHAYRTRAGIWRAIGWALFILLAIAGGAAAQTAVDLQLVLAVDASGSVDQVRFELQTLVSVAAFRQAPVQPRVPSAHKRATAPPRHARPRRTGGSRHRDQWPPDSRARA